MESDDDADGHDRRTPGTASDDAETVVAAERLLRSLHEHGVTRLFANLGTDHAPLLEAAARLDAADRTAAYPEIVVCPHEFAAMSAAHGYTAATGEPQAVLVHVDVGTQNLGAAMHNAHRSRVPMVVLAGLAPITDEGFVGSRNNVVQYVQDVFDQPGVVREYYRWTGEYKPPADPDQSVVRALERAQDVPQGPTYLTATREALETPIRPTEEAGREVRSIRRPGADDGTLHDLAALVAAAERPAVVVGGSHATDEHAAIQSLVDFAEAAGAGVIEHSPTRLCFPRTHDLHVGFDPATAVDHADLLVAVDVDVPWIPWDGSPPAEMSVVQIDPEPTKATYPSWDFDVDVTAAADPVTTLDRLATRLDPDDGAAGRDAWRERHRAIERASDETLAAHRDADRLTPAVVAAAVDDLVDDRTVVVNDATTSSGAVLRHVDLSRPGSYRGFGGSGLGWGAAAAVGVKLAEPDSRVIATVGDGAYVFANPTACAWLAAAHGAPTLTVVVNNGGWNAVSLSTQGQHPQGVAAEEGVPGSAFAPRLELSRPATVVGAHTERVTERSELAAALRAAAEAVDGGTPAVVDVHVEPVE